MQYKSKVTCETVDNVFNCRQFDCSRTETYLLLPRQFDCSRMETHLLLPRQFDCSRTETHLLLPRQFDCSRMETHLLLPRHFTLLEDQPSGWKRATSNCSVPYARNTQQLTLTAAFTGRTSSAHERYDSRSCDTHVSRLCSERPRGEERNMFTRASIIIPLTQPVWFKFNLYSNNNTVLEAL